MIADEAGDQRPFAMAHVNLKQGLPPSEPEDVLPAVRPLDPLEKQAFQALLATLEKQLLETYATAQHHAGYQTKTLYSASDLIRHYDGIMKDRAKINEVRVRLGMPQL